MQPPPEALALSLFMYSVSKRINVGCMYIPSKVISVRMRSAISSSLYKTNPYAQVGLRLSRAVLVYNDLFRYTERVCCTVANVETIEILLLYGYLYREVL